MDVVDSLASIGVVPVLEVDDPVRAEELADALSDGGLPCAEVTLRTPAALHVIARIARARPDLLVGAGTVLSAEQAAQARDAGAQFIVSPGYSPSVVDYCQRTQITVIPGVATPTEIEMVLGRGLRVMKVFPVSVLGGVTFIRAVAAPYVGVRFLPTGGISPANLQEYLDLSCVLAVGGSWVAPRAMIAAADFAEIRRRAADAADSVRAIRAPQSRSA
jgi:2-dehydro-3-deoxyphosphogluconate aldolase/(4S)-4-hydroxy-2-oxoglutarate aldolase